MPFYKSATVTNRYFVQIIKRRRIPNGPNRDNRQKFFPIGGSWTNTPGGILYLYKLGKSTRGQNCVIIAKGLDMPPLEISSPH